MSQNSGPSARTLACLLLLLLAAPMALAAVPLKVPTQGTLRDNAGVLVAEDVFAMSFALYDAPDALTPVWTEAWPPQGVDCSALPQACVFVSKGRFSVDLGTHTELDLDLIATAPSLWLGVRVEDEPELPRRPLGSAPYALHAASAAGLTCTDCLGVEALTDEAVAALQGGAVQTINASLAPVANSGGFQDLVGIPQGLADGDDDTLAGLPCDEGEVAKTVGDAWVCASDNVLDEGQVKAWADEVDDIGLTVESDPRVASTAQDKWCRGTGDAVTCDQDPPSSGASVGDCIWIDVASAPAGQAECPPDKPMMSGVRVHYINLNNGWMFHNDQSVKCCALL